MRVLQCDNCRRQINEDYNRYVLQDLQAINTNSREFSDQGVVDLCLDCAGHILYMVRQDPETYAPNVCPPAEADGTCNWRDRYGNEWSFKDGQWSTTLTVSKDNTVSFGAPLYSPPPREETTLTPMPPVV